MVRSSASKGRAEMEVGVEVHMEAGRRRRETGRRRWQLVVSEAAHVSRLSQLSPATDGYMADRVAKSSHNSLVRVVDL